MVVPRGIKQIVAAYGQPARNGKLDPKWLAENTIVVTLPFPMRLAWRLSTIVRKCRLHRKAAPVILEALEQVWVYGRLQVKKQDGFDKLSSYYDREGLRWLQRQGVDRFGGAFTFRIMRNGTKLSTHAFAIAIDFDPEHNAMGTPGTLPRWLVRIFEGLGFAWGGRWKGNRCDPMHFQLAVGY